MHLNKAAIMDAIYRVTGSVAFIAQARAAWAVVADPQDSSRRLFLKLKGNLAPTGVSGLAFTITAPSQLGRPVLRWLNESVDVPLRDVIGGFSVSRRGPKPNKLEAAKAFLLEMLKDGRWHLCQIIYDSKPKEISKATLSEAANALGIKRRKDGLEGGWRWSLSKENTGSSPSTHENSKSSSDPHTENDFSEDLELERNSESSKNRSEDLEFPKRNSDSSANPLSPKEPVDSEVTEKPEDPEFHDPSEDGEKF
jgi:putative DNA primase/helicase